MPEKTTRWRRRRSRTKTEKQKERRTNRERRENEERTNRERTENEQRTNFISPPHFTVVVVNPLIVLPLPGIIIGVGLLWLGYSSMKTKRLIEDTPTSKIRSIAMGFVEVKGLVEKGERTIAAPISGDACCAYRCDVEALQRDEDGDEHWRRVKSVSGGVPFFVKDETGRVLIDPKAANVTVKLTNGWGSALTKDPPKNVQQFLEKEGVKFKNVIGLNKTMRYQEFLLVPKMTVYVLGVAGSNPHVAAGSAVKSVDRVMISAGDLPKLFTITDTPEHALVKQFTLRMYAGLIVGGVILLGSLWFLLLIAAATS